MTEARKETTGKKAKDKIKGRDAPTSHLGKKSPLQIFSVLLCLGRVDWIRIDIFLFFSSRSRLDSSFTAMGLRGERHCHTARRGHPSDWSFSNRVRSCYVHIHTLLSLLAKHVQSTIDASQPYPRFVDSATQVGRATD